MNVLLATDRFQLSENIRISLHGEVEELNIYSLNNELFDHIYLLKPDIILFDISSKKRKKVFEFINTFTTAPSIREIPLIVIIHKKTSKMIEKICGFEIFDYITEPFIKAELMMKINRANEIVGMKKEFNKLLTKDPLTGAYNRGFLMERINEELNWCGVYREPFSLVIFDIDFFKKINDTYGHLTGDKVLGEVVALAMDFFPNHGIIGRYGGEEFCVVLPSTNEEETLNICEGFRKEVEIHDFHTFRGDIIKLTVSLGFTTIRGEVRISPDEIIQKADIALYKAKQSGRNRVIYEAFELE